MRIIELNADKFSTVLQFYDALLAALGAPEWHGYSIDALLDSMVWGGVNEVNPPYTIRVINAKHLPKVIGDEIELLTKSVREALVESISRRGRAPNISFELVP